VTGLPSLEDLKQRDPGLITRRSLVQIQPRNLKTQTLSALTERVFESFEILFGSFDSFLM